MLRGFSLSVLGDGSAGNEINIIATGLTLFLPSIVLLTVRCGRCCSCCYLFQHSRHSPRTNAHVLSCCAVGHLPQGDVIENTLNVEFGNLLLLGNHRLARSKPSSQAKRAKRVGTRLISVWAPSKAGYIHTPYLYDIVHPLSFCPVPNANSNDP